MLKSDLEFGFEDMIVTVSEIHLSWWDRIKVLCGVPIFNECRTQTEHVVGRTLTVGETTVPRAFWRAFSHVGVMNVGKGEG